MCLMSPEQLRNKFPWINTDGVALASYGEAGSQRASGCGHLGWKPRHPAATSLSNASLWPAGPPQAMPALFFRGIGLSAVRQLDFPQLTSPKKS